MVLDSENEEHFMENTEGRGAHGEDKSSFFISLLIFEIILLSSSRY